MPEIDDMPDLPPLSTDPSAAIPAGRTPPWRLILPAVMLIAAIAAGIALRATGGGRGAAPAGIPTALVVDLSEPSPFKGIAIVPERPAPDFTLDASSGRPFRMGDTRGKVVLLFFGFTYCPDICPTAMGKMAGALKELGTDAERVAVVFVSVDPERDTPSVLADYLAAFDSRIVGVTGAIPDLERVAQDYGVRFFKEYPEGTPAGGSDYSMAHSSTVFVIDPFGQIRTSFMEPYTPADIAHDVRMLLAE